MLSQQSFCSNKEAKTAAALIEKFKERFMEEIKAHYTRLADSNSISQKQKRQYLKRYENPEVKVCRNPQNASQKVVYIEYEKNWWGKLYFASVSGNEILSWNPINTHGAFVKSVRWEGRSFFYEDSTHSGTKTQNTCRIQKNSVPCQRLKQ